jgi:hypothetical protein
MASGKGFALKQFLRIQAYGKAYYQEDNAYMPMRELRGTFRFEGVMPSISFQTLAINPIPILATPLSLELTTRQHCAERPRMGFLSLNQTRKLIMLQADDSSVSIAPVVGVWIRYDTVHDFIHSDPKIAQEDALQHPLTWAAAVRFVMSERLAQRVFVSEDTFLVVRPTPCWHVLM